MAMLERDLGPALNARLSGSENELEESGTGHVCSRKGQP